MSGWTILALVIGPAIGLALLLLTPLRRRVAALAGLAALPAVVLGIAGMMTLREPEGQLAPLILSLSIGFDGMSAALLAQLGIVWAVVGVAVWRGRPVSRRFPLACLLLTMAGSLGCVIALDMVSFYVFLSVMTVASFGLVDTGRQDASQRRAGRVYLSLALVGEFLTLAGFMAAWTGATGSWYVLLLYFGIGAKLGVLPLHVALPLVYGAAPRAGAAVMGGALLNAAAVGWLRFLPMAGETLAAAAPALLVAGLTAAFLGVVLGLAQTSARPALGYSTVSQMGLFTAFTAVAAAEPASFDVVVPVLLVFLVHHGLSKTGLLLAVGSGRLGLALIVVLSLALAAAPATGGAIAKLWMEEEFSRLPGPWHDLAKQVVPYTSAATALLMARITWLAAGERAGGPSLAWPAVPAAVAALVLPWAMVLGGHVDAVHLVLAPGHLWKTAWPALLGPAVFGLAWLATARGRRWPSLPPGDVLVPVERAGLVSALDRLAGRGGGILARRAGRAKGGGVVRLRQVLRGARQAEGYARDMRVLGGAFVGLILLFAGTVLFYA